MNKKTITTLSALALSGAMLVGSIAASAQGLGGYDTLKKALLNFGTQANQTTTIDLSVKVDGVVVESAKTMTMVENASTHYTEVTNENETLQTWFSKDQMITKNLTSDSYYVEKLSDESGHSSDSSNDLSSMPNSMKFAEVLIDTLMGDTKNLFNVKSTDKGSEVSLDLSGAQIPELLRLGIAAINEVAMAEKSSQGGISARSIDHSDFETLMSTATKFEIQSLSGSAIIRDDNTIDSGHGTFVVSMTDASGKTHSAEMSFTASTADVGTTVVTMPDLTGKTVLSMDEYYVNENLTIKIPQSADSESTAEVTPTPSPSQQPAA